MPSSDMTLDEAKSMARKWGCPEEYLSSSYAMKIWLDGYRQGFDSGSNLAIDAIDKAFGTKQ